MYCPNCKKTVEGVFCPECGTKLIEEPKVSGGARFEFGDANAISGGVNYSDSHAVHSEDNRNLSTTNISTSDSHNVSNTNVDSHDVHTETHITNNTIQERQKTEEELMQDKRQNFREFCSAQISEDGRYSSVALKNISMKQCDLGIGDTDAARIKEEVSRFKRAKNVSALSQMDLIDLESAVNAIKENRPSVNDKLRKLEGMIERTSDDSVHFHYYVLLASINPERIIKKFETRVENDVEDNYWLTFWAAFCYERAGMDRGFNEAKALLLSWSDMPEENEFLLSADEKAGMYFLKKGDIEELDMAKSLLAMAKDKCSPLLEDFRRSLAAVLDKKVRAVQGCDFYLDRFFSEYVYPEPAPAPTPVQTQASSPASVSSPAITEANPTVRASSAAVTGSPEKKKSGCGCMAVVLVLLIAIVVLLISKCTGGKDSSVQSPTPAPAPVPVEAVSAQPSNPEQPSKVEETKQPESKSQDAAEKSAGQTSPATTNGSCKYGAGTYYGAVKAGKPADGKGTIKYPDGGLVDSRDPKQTQANPGDYVEGFFKNGHLVQGYLYSGDKKIAIMIGE